MMAMGLDSASLIQIWFKIVFCFQSIQVCGTSNYENFKQTLLCSAQCEALCIDKGPNCEQICNGEGYWINACDHPGCAGTCSTLYDNYIYHQNLLVPSPSTIFIIQNGRDVELLWMNPKSDNAIIYVVEQHTTDPQLSTTNITYTGWVHGDGYKVQLQDICDHSRFRIMAINQFGSLGFGNPLYLSGAVPGPVENITYVGKGVYFYSGSNRSNTEYDQFMAILQWEDPKDWDGIDIRFYNWNQAVIRNCTDIQNDVIPIFQKMNNQSHRILVRMPASAFGCVFTAQVRAISKCNTHGPWTNFTIDLTDCHSIIGYSCVPQPFNPPGNVENVSVTVDHNYLHLGLHITWSPPSDLGSQGDVDYYIIHTGRVERHEAPVPPTFLGIPTPMTINKSSRDVILPLSNYGLPYTYGVQIVPVAPGQIIKDNEWGLYPVYSVRVTYGSDVQSVLDKGRLLYNSSDVLIVYVPSMLEVQFMWNLPQVRIGNTSVNHYALQWGPLVGPNKISMENSTVVPANQSYLRVALERRGLAYGLKIKSLNDSEDEPVYMEWEGEPVISFRVPGDALANVTVVEKVPNDSGSNMTSLYIMLPILVLVIVMAFFIKAAHTRRKFWNLEQRLAEVEEEEEDGFYNHYTSMLPGPQELDAASLLTPPVVADKWELPHSCLRCGRVLGSGAFGQVLKGRISCSIIRHRGIKIPDDLIPKGMHFPVAIKIVHENTDQQYVNDFLKEIKMMKAIGYHRNIVSMIGCCTLREPYCLVVEHVPYGDLLSYLCKIRAILRQREEECVGYINQDVGLFSPKDLLSVSRQITVGMEYLSQKGFVHRDLAARNVLVGPKKTVKIADFGLTRYIYDDINKVYVNRNGGKLPLKWMSPEAIFEMVFSTASDVWAFGVVLFEIITLGGTPYPQVSNTNLLQELRHSYRMKRPENCSQEIYEIMLWCWQEDPKARPSFTDLRQVFESMLEKDSEGEYFNFNIDEKKDYYQVDEEAVESIEETDTEKIHNYETEKTDLSLYKVSDVQAEFARQQKHKDAINDPTSFIEGTSHRSNGLAEISTKYRITGLNIDDPSILKSNLNKANSGIEKLNSRSNFNSQISVMVDVHSEDTGVVNTNHEDVTMEDDRIYRSECYIETTGPGNSTLETVDECQNPTLETVNEWQNKDSELRCFSKVYTNKNSGIFYAKNEFKDKQDETVDENSRNQRAFDDVFTNCASCIPLPLTDGSSGQNSCQACGRTFPEMTTCKRIHTSDGNDSAFSSTSSECLSDYSQGPHSEHRDRRMGLDLAQLNEDARDYSAISSFLVRDSYLLKSEGILRKDTRESHSYSQISLSEILPESASPPLQIIQKKLPYIFVSDAVSQELNETRVQKFYPLEFLIAHKDITISTTRL